MTVDDFIADLTALGEELSDPQSVLTEIGSELVSQMRADAPVDTGALRSSINYIVNGNTLEFSMLYYGFFQNYGVNGTQDSLGTPVPAFGVLQPTSPPYYAFRTRRFGLRPQPFFNMDNLTNQIANVIADETADF